MTKINIYTDMDGVQAVYGADDTVEIMAEKGYFRDRPVQKNVIDAMKILNADPRFDLAVLSAVFPEAHNIPDKKAWLIKQGIGDVRTIFLPCGENKGDYVDKDELNILIDDYSKNLFDWEKTGPKFKGIKFLNRTNSTNGTWKSAGGEVVDYRMTAEEIYQKVSDIAEAFCRKVS